MSQDPSRNFTGFPLEILGSCDVTTQEATKTTKDGFPQEEILREIHSVEVNWRHPLEIQGIPVPANQDSALHTLWMLGCMDLPENMAGQETLDIGCSDGFFCFETEARGAKRSVGMDRWWGGGPGGVTVPNYDKTVKEVRERVTSKPFSIAHKYKRSKVEFFQGDIQRLELTPEVANSKFDTIFFLGVLYHLEDPLRALRHLRSICRGRVFVESTVIKSDKKVMAYLGLPHDIQWRPTDSCLMAMLEGCGFAKVRKLGERTDRMIFEATV